MSGRSWGNRLWLTAAAASLSIALAQSAAGAGTVKGDAAAWAEIVAAFKKLERVSYRTKMTSRDVTMIREFAPPNSVHVVSQTPAGGTEIIIVGTVYATRVPGDKWLCPQIPQETWKDTFFPKAGELPGDQTVTVTRVQGLVIDGMPTRGYDYTFTNQVQGRPSTSHQKLYVGVQTGLPRRASMEGDGYASSIDYYDYGAKITITPPSCS